MEQQPFKRAEQEKLCKKTPKDTAMQAERQPGVEVGGVGGASHLAEISREARQAEALEAVHLVLTASAVQARPTRTLVNVPLAVLAGEARGARATVVVHQVLRREETGEGGGVNIVTSQV